MAYARVEIMNRVETFAKERLEDYVVRMADAITQELAKTYSAANKDIDKLTIWKDYMQEAINNYADLLKNVIADELEHIEEREEERQAQEEAEDSLEENENTFEDFGDEDELPPIPEDEEE